MACFIKWLYNNWYLKAGFTKATKCFNRTRPSGFQWHLCLQVTQVHWKTSPLLLYSNQCLIYSISVTLPVYEAETRGRGENHKPSKERVHVSSTLGRSRRCQQHTAWVRNPSAEEQVPRHQGHLGNNSMIIPVLTLPKPVTGRHICPWDKAHKQAR